MLTYLLNSFSHLLFPRFCPGCGSDAINNAQSLCVNCLMQLPETGYFDIEENPVKHIFTGRLPITHAASMYYCAKSSVLHSIIHQLKYKGQQSNGIFLGEMVGHGLSNSNWGHSLDAMIPVPLHPNKQKLRGYNQAEMIAEGIAHILPIPIYPNALIRTAATETQTHKGRTDRSLSMQGKFRVVQPEILAGKHIALVDDLITTGATLEFCGLEILKVPDTKLSIITVGKAVH